MAIVSPTPRNPRRAGRLPTGHLSPPQASLALASRPVLVPAEAPVLVARRLTRPRGVETATTRTAGTTLAPALATAAYRSGLLAEPRAFQCVRQTLARVLTLVLVACPLVFSPTGLADGNDDEFLQAMSYVGLVSDDGPAGLIRLAHKVCQDRANGYSDLISATRVNNSNPGLGINGAGYIVASAEHVYCPLSAHPGEGPRPAASRRLGRPDGGRSGSTANAGLRRASTARDVL
jgi:hypothetical protein